MLRNLKHLFFLIFLYPGIGLASNPPVLAVIDFFPFGYMDKDGRPAGMFLDMAQAISKESGKAIDARIMPVPRALRDASRGAVDMLISYKDPIMVPNVEFVGNVGCLTAYIIASKGSGVRSIQDLENKRIGLIPGGYFQKRFKGRIPYIEVQVPSNQAMLKMLVRGRLDGFIINSAVFDAFYNLGSPIELPSDWRTKVDPPARIEVLETHLSISLNSAHLADKADYTSAIKKLYEDGTMAGIFQKYGSIDRGSCTASNLVN